MARKTRRNRSQGPAAAKSSPGSDTPDIADAETLPAGAPEDAPLAPSDTLSPADDTLLATEPAPSGDDTLVADAETLPAAADDTLLAADPGGEPAIAGDVTPDDPLGDPTRDPLPSAGDTVPPENDPADLADLARMDGVDPDDTLVTGDETLRSAGEDGTEGVLVGDVRSDDAEPVGRDDDAGGLPPVIAPAPQVIEKRGPGFLPLVLGGLVAGAIGYAIPTFLSPDPVAPAPAPAVDEARIAALEARIDGLPEAGTDAEAPDLAPIQAAQADLSERIDQLSARIDALEARPAAASAAEQSAGASTAAPEPSDDGLAQLLTRVDQLSDLPGRVDTLSDGLSSLSDRVDALAAEIEAMPAPPADMTDRVAALEAELAALGEETVAVETSAEERAREAAANQLRVAVESGAPFAEPLEAYGDPAPEVLASNAESGVPTVDALTAAFPEAARAALTEARRTQPDQPGLAGFIRRATGARSLEPREGDDADAVLSRAEASIRANDVEAALREVESLPEDARAAMSDWIARARTRVEARAALQDYLGTE